MDEKINILFDATILINGTVNAPARSGVYFVAYNVLMELLKREEFNINFYVDKGNAHLALEAINADGNFKNIPIAKHSKLDNLIIKFDVLKYKNKVNKGNKITRVFIKLTLSLLKILLKIKNKLNLCNEYQKLFKDYDIFFSPVFEISQEIRKVDNLKRYTILYDIIPIIFPENYTDMQNKSSWFLKLINSINEKDYYFSISDYTKQDFIKNVKNITPDHITTIPLSTGQEYERVEAKSQIEEIREKYNIPKDKKYLFSLCTLEPRKNLIFAIKNFIEFIKKNNIDDFVFVLGGGHWDVFIKELNNTIEDLDNFKDKIIRLGYVADEDMAGLYSGAEMFVFPSIYEGFGIPILEAMQCGCPVITSSVTSMPEVVGNCGIQIDPTNDESIIVAFEKMYFDKDFKEQCIKKGYERTKDFTWEKCTDVITEDILKEFKPLVTVVTVTYNLVKNNRTELFIKALESVHNQTYSNIEHIIIDGASEDGSIDLIKEYEDKGWIKYISEPDNGIYDAMNKGANIAQGKYILFLNSDDYFSGLEGVGKSVCALEKINADFSYSKAKIVDEDGNLVKGHLHNKTDFVKIFTEMPFSHQTLMVKTAVFKELGMFDLQYKSAADYDFVLKLAFNKCPQVFIPFEFVTYKTGGYSNEDKGQSIKDVSRIYFNHYNRYCKLSLTECENIFTTQSIPIPLLFKLISNTGFGFEISLKLFVKYLKKRIIRIRINLKHPYVEIFGKVFIKSKSQ